MQPSSCMIDQLLPRDREKYMPRIVEFSCDHVINGSTQLLPLAVSRGPSNYLFEFTYEKRTDKKMVSAG